MTKILNGTGEYEYVVYEIRNKKDLDWYLSENEKLKNKPIVEKIKETFKINKNGSSNNR